MSDADVHAYGPLFDGRAAIEIKDGVEAIRKRLAQEGQKLAMAAFAESIRDNHGRFLASITTTDRSRVYSTTSGHKTYSLPVVVDSLETTIVTTDLATYGPWLEGVGSRNETTRFKGYHGFRRAGQELDRRAQGIAEETIRPYVERANA